MDSNPIDNEVIHRAFGEQVPEIASGVVEIKGVAREPGERTIVAVHSLVSTVCPVGACVGIKGVRVKAIGKNLLGEKVDIVRWSEVIEDFIRNALAPGRIARIDFDTAGHAATIYVAPKCRPLFVPFHGTRLRLVSRLAGWDIRVI